MKLNYYRESSADSLQQLPMVLSFLNNRTRTIENFGKPNQRSISIFSGKKNGSVVRQ